MVAGQGKGEVEPRILRTIGRSYLETKWEGWGGVSCMQPRRQAVLLKVSSPSRLHSSEEQGGADSHQAPPSPNSAFSDKPATVPWPRPQSFSMAFSHPDWQLSHLGREEEGWRLDGPRGVVRMPHTHSLVPTVAGLATAAAADLPTLGKGNTQ